MRRRKGFYEACIKRPLDFVCALGGIIVLSPVMLAVSIAIKLTSEGPIFFKQERVGKNQKIFEIIKFRTMVVNAEHIGDGLKVKEDSDPRITKIGKILRRTSLDEIPQLINVLKGDMSLIGPRPPVTYHPYKVGEYDNIKKQRFDVRPGITGLAQAKIRNGGSWDERISYDLKYVKNITFKNDIKILKETVSMVLRKDSLY
ncbi:MULTISPECIES: sugar transferase [Oscillospiraceae]|uniref:sugar transferase n=1 Tax=Oscillospiraceae TaxID=216572 RepID=UPI001105FDCC|nr:MULTISPECIES: sugar transferase [Oscillospiraceae]